MNFFKRNIAVLVYLTFCITGYVYDLTIGQPLAASVMAVFVIGAVALIAHRETKRRMESEYHDDLSAILDVLAPPTERR